MEINLQSKVDLLKDLIRDNPKTFPYTAIEDVDHKDGELRVLTHNCMGSAGIITADGLFIDRGAWKQQEQLSALLEVPVKLCFVMGRYYTLEAWDVANK